MSVVVSTAYVLLAIALSLLAISFHELGHAFKMRKYGIEIKEICLLGFGRVLYTFRLPFWFGDTPIHIKSILLGASVEITDAGTERIDRLPYHAYADIYGGGIIANIVYILLLISFLFLSFGILTITSDVTGALYALEIALLLVGVGYLIWRYAHYVSAYLFPPLSLLIMYLVFEGLLHVSSFKEAQDSLGGPVGVATIGTNIYNSYQGLAAPVMTAVLVSVALGSTNLIPLIPLDGGHLMLRLIRALVPTQYPRMEMPLRIGMASLVLVLVFLALLSDLSRLVMYVVHLVT